MIILTISKNGTIHLPEETVKRLGDRRDLIVRYGKSGIILRPVAVEAIGGKKAVPFVTQ
jgi:hypothetical protein